MAKRIDASLAVKLPRVFPFEHRIVEHHRCADEIDTVLGEITLAARFLPLEHDALTRPCSQAAIWRRQALVASEALLDRPRHPPYSAPSHTRPAGGSIPPRRLET